MPESFTIVLPDRVVERLRLLAKLEERSPEEFLVSAAVDSIDSSSEVYHRNYTCEHSADDDRREALALNRPRKGGRRA